MDEGKMEKRLVGWGIVWPGERESVLRVDKIEAAEAEAATTAATKGATTSPSWLGWALGWLGTLPPWQQLSRHGTGATPPPSTASTHHPARIPVAACGKQDTLRHATWPGVLHTIAWQTRGKQPAARTRTPPQTNAPHWHNKYRIHSCSQPPLMLLQRSMAIATSDHYASRCTPLRTICAIIAPRTGPGEC